MRSLTYTVLLAIAPSTVVGQAGVPVAFQVDWRDKRSDQLLKLRSGRETRIAVDDLTPFCFSYTIRVNQLPVVEQSNRSVASILLGDAPIPSELSISSANEVKPVVEGARVMDQATKQLRDVSRNELSRFANVVEDFKKVKESIDAASLSYAETVKLSKLLTEKRNQAKKSLTDFVTTTCQKSERGAAHKSAKVNWTDTAKVKLTEFANDEEGFSKLLASVRTAWSADSLANLRLSAILANPAVSYREYLESPDGRVAVLQHQLLINGLQELIKTASDGPVGTLAKDRVATRGHIKLLDEIASEPARHEQPTFLRENTDRIEVTVIATGRALPGDVVPPSTTETYEAPVMRRARIATTAGFAMSWIASKSFARVTFPRFAGDTLIIKDSVYSTYADRGPSRNVVFAPFVQTHVSLWDADLASVYMSGGIGARSVARSAAPEYLLGMSVGFGDRAFLTLGSHWGRKEVLLLGDEDVVRARPVPTTVGDESAIGTRWAAAFAMVLSWKL